MVNHDNVPSNSRIFFCTFSLYQPEDVAPGGLSIEQQVALNPFAEIIESKPKHGIFVMHTTISEVYERLWVAHEADVGIEAHIEMRGLFDRYRWSTSTFKSNNIKTIDGKCGVKKDRKYIHGLILERGGYERLDRVIRSFRGSMVQELRRIIGNISFGSKDQVRGDWACRRKKVDEEGKPCGPYEGHFVPDLVQLNYAKEWEHAFERLARQYNCPFNYSSLPFGASSYPFGPPNCEQMPEDFGDYREKTCSCCGRTYCKWLGPNGKMAGCL